MKLTKLLCGVALGGLLASNAMAADLLYSSPAQQTVSYGGPYVGIKGGVNWIGSDPTFFGDAGDAATPDTLSFDTGFNVGLIGGYSFGQRWGMFSPRIEVELGYLRNNLSSFKDDGAVVADATGDLHSFYGLANFLLDIPMSGWGFTPFIGAGVGFANTRSTVTSITLGGVDQFSDDTNFAWDVTAGVSYDISRNVTFDIAYRFLQFTSVNNTFNGLGGDTGGSISSHDIDNHQVTAGVRVHL
jgi:opacity protein-like surface antigen